MAHIDLLLTRFHARLEELHVGASSVGLFIPDMEAVRREFERAVAVQPASTFPYWARLWPSSIALSEYISTHADLFAGKRVLEIAGGLGLPSLTASFAAAQVVFTDVDPNAVTLFSKVADLNHRSNVSAEVLDWHYFPEHIAGDILLLSDVNYNQQSFEALHAIIRRFLESGSLVLLSTPMRLVGRSFVEPLMPMVIDQDVRTVRFDGNESLISVLAMKILERDERPRT